MSEIIKIIYHGKEALLSVLATQKETQALKGHNKDILLIPAGANRQKTKIVRRGKKERTTYILVPKNMRQDITKTTKVEIARIDTEKETILIQIMKRKGKLK